jgi:hypothetical protein
MPYYYGYRMCTLSDLGAITVEPPARLLLDKTCGDVPCLFPQTRRHFYNNVEGVIEMFGRGKHGAVVVKRYRLPLDESKRRVVLADGDIYVARELPDRSLEISLDINEYLKHPFIVVCRRMRLPSIRPPSPRFPRGPMGVNRE